MNHLDGEGNNPVIYHEKQVKAFCALHALNNVLQEKRFTREDLDEICKELEPESWINPHKSILGIGNYDVNVLMEALRRCDKELLWFDKRKEAEGVINLANVIGFIVNIPCKGWQSWLSLSKKHWIAIRTFQGNYYELDSKSVDPKLIGNEQQLFAHLRQKLVELPETELFLVLERNIATSGSWKLNSSENVENQIEYSATLTNTN